jgi:Concanavalin A-like lectin/glucanases superfamily/FecR protein
MSTLPRDHAELDKILGAFREGLATPEQMARLDSLLLSDPEARDYYLEYIEIYSTLRHYQGSSSQGERIGREAIDREKAPKRFAFPRVDLRWLAAAAALLAAVWFGSYLAQPRGVPGLANQEKTPSTTPDGMVAVLSRSVDAVWGPMSLPTEAGSALTKGRLNLKSGLVQVEFYRGAILVLEGPADLELLGTERALCRQGKVRVRVTGQSGKFSIETPNAEVVDLGTEFGVRVDETGGTHVRVFEGKVEVVGNRVGRPSEAGQLLTTGQTIHLDQSGALRKGEFSPEPFEGAMELDEQSHLESQHRYQAWSDWSRKIQADPRVVLYFSFEGQEHWDRSLRDQVKGRATKLDGAIVGCQWSEGRWPGKSSLEFKRPSDRVRVNIPGEYRALTLMTWVRVDAFDRRFSSLLLSDGGWNKPGIMHWQLDREGYLKFGLNKDLNYRSPSVFDDAKLGLWTHLATVFDGQAGSITHFVDGRQVGTRVHGSEARAEIGWADIGNWDVPPPSDSEPIRNFNGRMDEFILFNQALDRDEIRAIFEVGKPDL